MSARWVFLVIPLLWIAGVPGHAQKDVHIPEEWDGDPALQEWYVGGGRTDRLGVRGIV